MAVLPIRSEMSDGRAALSWWKFRYTKVWPLLLGLGGNLSSTSAFLHFLRYSLRQVVSSAGEWNIAQSSQTPHQFVIALMLVGKQSFDARPSVRFYSSQLRTGMSRSCVRWNADSLLRLHGACLRSLGSSPGQYIEPAASDQCNFQRVHKMSLPISHDPSFISSPIIDAKMSVPDRLTHGKHEVAPGVQIHYVVAGEGTRILLLIHGFPETWWQWRFVIPLFAQAGYRVIAVDYRGAGNSSKPPTGYDKRTMARDIRSLLSSAFHVQDPVDMVGHDLGMKVAFAYAALYPADIRKLVLVDAIIPGMPHFHNLLTTGKLANFDLAHFFFHNAKNNVAETLTAGRERVYIQDFFDRHAYNLAAFPSEVIDVYAKAYAAPGGMRAAFEVYRAFDQDAKDNQESFAASGKLRMPMLFVAGAQSGFLETVAKTISDEIAEHGSFVTIANSGHYVAEENPEAFADAVQTFLAL